MSVTVEKKEHNMAVLTVTASAQELTQALNDAWKKDRKRINIPGFRRGKAPVSYTHLTLPTILLV